MSVEVSATVKEALRLEELYGASEAARRTGVPRYALGMWRRRLKLEPLVTFNPALAPRCVVDSYLRFRVRELERLRRRAFEGCRCPRPFMEDDGLCILCGHPADWQRYRLAMHDALTLTAGSAEAGHDRDMAAVS
jgi:hypothetical protein